MNKICGKKIAVIDDTAGNLMLFTALLEAHGAEVMTTASGREFLAQLPTITPDLILLDIQMPDMDGYAVFEQLRKNSATLHTPVVALTAHAMSGDREKILELGFTGYIAKPLNTRDFPLQVATFITDQALSEVVRAGELKKGN